MAAEKVSASGGGADKPAKPKESAAQRSTPPLEAQQRALMAKMVAASFGEVVTLMMRTPRYRKMPIETLEVTAAAPVALGQVAIAGSQSKETGALTPVAAVLWARVSPEVDRRLSNTENETGALAINEWRSGDIPWIIEAVGEREALGKLLHQLVTTVFRDRPPKIRTAGADGKPTVGRLERVDPQARKVSTEPASPAKP